MCEMGAFPPPAFDKPGRPQLSPPGDRRHRIASRIGLVLTTAPWIARPILVRRWYYDGRDEGGALELGRIDPSLTCRLDRTLAIIAGGRSLPTRRRAAARTPPAAAAPSSALPRAHPLADRETDLVVLYGLDRAAAGLGALLAQLIGLRNAVRQRLLALPHRDRHRLAAAAIHKEVRVREALDPLKRIRDGLKAFQELVGVIGAVAANPSEHRRPPVGGARTAPLSRRAAARRNRQSTRIAAYAWVQSSAPTHATCLPGRATRRRPRRKIGAQRALASVGREQRPAYCSYPCEGAVRFGVDEWTSALLPSRDPARG